MGQGLSHFARRFLVEPDAFIRELVDPVVVWEAVARDDTGDVMLTTAGDPRQQPSSQDPIVFVVRKLNKPSNAFAMGITVGRTAANDLVVSDSTVSRFHAYFQHDRGNWSLVDADSKFGTWVGPMKLTPSKAAVVPDQAKLRFGNVEARFMLPNTFLGYVRKATTG
ncbi:MAG: FHA domain-containing protein [Myxococcaceae bacterium]